MMKTLTIVVGLYIACGGTAWADQAYPTKMTNHNSIWFDNWVGLRDATLKVAAPGGTITVIREASGAPVFRLSGTRILDGIYRFELSAATDGRATFERNPEKPAGNTLAPSPAKTFRMSGGFLVENGSIVTPTIDEFEENQD